MGYSKKSCYIYRNHKLHSEFLLKLTLHFLRWIQLGSCQISHSGNCILFSQPESKELASLASLRYSLGNDNLKDLTSHWLGHYY